MVVILVFYTSAVICTENNYGVRPRRNEFGNKGKTKQETNSFVGEKSGAFHNSPTIKLTPRVKYPKAPEFKKVNKQSELALFFSKPNDEFVTPAKEGVLDFGKQPIYQQNQQTNHGILVLKPTVKSSSFQNVPQNSNYHTPKFNSQKFQTQKSEFNYPKFKAQQAEYNYPKFEGRKPEPTYPKFQAQQPEFNYPQFEAQKSEYNYPKFEAQKPEPTYPQFQAQQPNFNYPQFGAQKSELNSPKFQQQKYIEYSKYKPSKPELSKFQANQFDPSPYQKQKFEQPKFNPPKLQPYKFDKPKFEAQDYEMPKVQAFTYRIPKLKSQPNYEAIKYEDFKPNFAYNPQNLKEENTQLHQSAAENINYGNEQYIKPTQVNKNPEQNIQYFSGIPVNSGNNYQHLRQNFGTELNYNTPVDQGSQASLNSYNNAENGHKFVDIDTFLKEQYNGAEDVYGGHFFDNKIAPANLKAQELQTNENLPLLGQKFSNIGVQNTNRAPGQGNFVLPSSQIIKFSNEDAIDSENLSKLYSNGDLKFQQPFNYQKNHDQNVSVEGRSDIPLSALPENAQQVNSGNYKSLDQTNVSQNENLQSEVTYDSNSKYGANFQPEVDYH